MGVRDVTKVIGVWVLLLFTYWVTYSIGHFNGMIDNAKGLVPVRCSSIPQYEDGTAACVIEIKPGEKINLYRER